jgi:ankyrin repeat protein
LILTDDGGWASNDPYEIYKLLIIYGANAGLSSASAEVHNYSSMLVWMLTLKNEHGYTGLMYGIIYKLVAFVDTLICVGARLDITSKRGCAALHYAIWIPDLEITAIQYREEIANMDPAGISLKELLKREIFHVH